MGSTLQPWRHSAGKLASVSEFTVRPFRPDDAALVHGVCFHQALLNGFFHGVPRDVLAKSVGDAVGFWTRSPDWQVDVATPVDPDLTDEVCGFAIRSGTGVVAFAYVKPAYRERGAWRALREAAGIREGQNVEVILGNPNALRLARRRYRVFFTPFRILEALPKGTP